MTSLSTFWTGLGRAARGGLVAGALLIVGLVAALGYWAYRPDYQVLFSDVAARDAAAMTAELDKMKTPYTLADGGSTVLVPRDLVYKTRLALMAKDVPLHGAVGFEVFNNADFGMTEFVQKVNYLRAIQGELTRTILAIEGIASARVHLALPDQGLFKKAATKPKASVTLSMKRGQVLGAEQVAGIQRLVAASVPDIVSGDVTVLDQHGVALTRASGDSEAVPNSGEQLDAKRSTEDYLVKKVAAVLDQTFGPGEAIASVDVALNLDRAKLTTEEVLPAKGTLADQPPAGVVVRDRQTVREADSGAGAVAKPAAGGVTTTENDYQVGRRVEQVATAGGTVRRMTVAVVVKKPLSDEQLGKLKEVVSLAVGLNAARGDAIVVNSMERLAGLATPAAAAAELPPVGGVPPAAPGRPDAASANVVIGVLAVLLVLALLAFAAALLKRRRAPQPKPVPRLDSAQREQMLGDVRRWIATPSDAHLRGIPK